MGDKSSSFINRIKERLNMRKIKDGISYGIIGLATMFTVGILVVIIGFIFINGIPHINMDFLTSNYDSKTNYLNVETTSGTDNNLGIILGTKEVEKETYISIEEIEVNSKIEEATNRLGEAFKIKDGDIIKKIGDVNIEDYSISEANELINNLPVDEQIVIILTRPGGGIVPLVVTSLYMIGLSLIIACPIGIFAAIYLVEYAKPGRMVNIIRFATESLAGIPSIIYGLFGMIVFVVFFHFEYSILSGALTLAIILLPVIIRQTEEYLKAVPMAYREASLGLGANKLQTIRKAVNL